MYKRFLASLLTLCMLLTLLPAAAMAAAVSGEEIPGKLLSIGEDEVGNLTFETFEDLKELASRTYDEYTQAYYEGYDTLEIKEDINIPQNLAIDCLSATVVVSQNVTFTASELSVGTLIVEGTVKCFILNVQTALNIPGTYYCEGIINYTVNSEGTLVGNENIIYSAPPDSFEPFVSWNYRISDMAHFKEVISVANAATDPHWRYYIDLNSETFIFNESIALPKNCYFDTTCVEYNPSSVTVSKGCTLDIYGVVEIRTSFMVDGSMVNNNEINIYYDNNYSNYGTMTISNSGTYGGSGNITIYSDELTDPQDAVPGLDLTNFNITEVETDYYEHQWELTPKGQSHSHSHTSVVTAPTCTEKGYTTYTCECGDTYTADEVAALGHKYENSTCTVCGEPDPSVKASVTRIYGDTRYETAYAVANELKTVLGVEKFDTIIVACGSNFPDALSGSYLAAVKDAPILLAKTNNDALLAYIQENLSKDGLVYILGSDVVVSKAFEDSLKAENIKVERLAGATRYLTNLAILEEAGITGNEMLISTSMNYADSLSASSTGLPILLINNSKKDLTAEQKEFLVQRDSWKFYILGSEAAVCAEFEDVLGEYGDVERVYGDVRESTSIAIAKAFCKAPENMVLAYSQEFPDGLCGGVLAYNLNAPLVLARTSEKIEKLVGEYVQEYGISQGIVLGSSKLISDDTTTAIFQK